MSGDEQPFVDMTVINLVSAAIDEVVAELGDGAQSAVMWARSWEHAMLACGHPYARLSLTTHQEGDGSFIVSYGWCNDEDAYERAALAKDHWHPSQKSWADAHGCFVLVDRLRPDYIQPSIALQEILDERAADHQRSGDN